MKIPPQNSVLYLVGTVHNDPDGNYRLRTLLDQLSPHRIVLELSSDRAQEFLSHTLEDRMREHEATIASWKKQGLVLTPEQRERSLQLARFKNKDYGFELDASLAYQQKHPAASIIYGDLPLPSTQESAAFVAGLRETFGMEKNSPLTADMQTNILQGLQSSIENYMYTLRQGVEENYRNALDSSAALTEMAHNPDLFEALALGLSPEARESFRFIVNPERNTSLARSIREGYTPQQTTISVMGIAHLYLVASLLEDLHPELVCLHEVPIPQT